MRGDQQNLRTRTANFRLYVVTGPSVELISVTSRPQTAARKRILDEIGGGIQLRIARHVSFADFDSERVHIGAQLITQPDFHRRKRH